MVLARGYSELDGWRGSGLKKILFLLAVWLAIPFNAQAAPAITSVSGTVASDQTITITGTGFGTGPTVEWLGGETGVIESGTDGTAFVATTARPGWVEEAPPGVAEFDTARAYSYSKSLVFDTDSHDTGIFGLCYDTGGNVTYAYVTYYTYFDNDGLTAGQWKMYRLMPIQSVVDSATPQWIVFNKRNFGGGSNAAFRTQTAIDGGPCVDYDDCETNWSLADGLLPNAGGWYRVEFFIKASSAYGATDATGKIILHNPGTSISQSYSLAGVLGYGLGDTRQYRWHVFQNYQGNGYGYHPTICPTCTTSVWMDDLYISNSPKRVEIGNASTWAACTQREIQPPTSWADTSIAVKLNAGTLTLVGSYLYVVDGTEEVSAGYLLGCAVDGDCNDSNPCTDDTCASGTCVFTNDNTNTCDDSLYCNGVETCSAGVCGHAGDPCTPPCETCTEATDSCDVTLDADSDGGISDACVGGTDCNDADPDINAAAIEGPAAVGSCTDGKDNDCDLTTDGADAGCASGDECNDPTDCDDDDACTTETCVAGACGHVAVVCDDSNGCTDDSCVSLTGCIYANNTAACDDGLYCTDPDACSGGSCTGATRDCKDSNLFTKDTCNETTNACVHTAQGCLGIGKLF